MSEEVEGKLAGVDDRVDVVDHVERPRDVLRASKQSTSFRFAVSDVNSKYQTSDRCCCARQALVKVSIDC